MSSNNASDSQPWLVPSLVENILKKWHNDETIKVYGISSKAAIARGENLMSDVSRIHATFKRGRTNNEETEGVNLIFKVAFKKDHLHDDPDTAQEEFKAEIRMMQNTLVKMEEILNEKDFRLSAKAYYSHLGNPSFLVLEDLADRGFRIAKRQDGLDLDHSRLVIKGLAKFHASSVALYEKEPNFTTFYQDLEEAKLADTTTVNVMIGFIKAGFEILAGEVKNWPEVVDPSCSEKILKLSEVCWEKRMEAVEVKENEFNVLNHGDPWTNNLMFRYDNDGNVVDQIFLDFQISAWRSPAIDLLYFLTTSPTDDVYVHHYDALIAEYWNTLTETMLRINCKTKPPSQELINQYIKERHVMAIIFSIIVLPLVLAEKTEVHKLADLVNPAAADFRLATFRNKQYRRAITRRLNDWNTRGLLDL